MTSNEALCVHIQGEVAFDPLPVEAGELYTYEPLAMDTNGPRVPDIEELERSGSVGMGVFSCEGMGILILIAVTMRHSVEFT